MEPGASYAKINPDHDERFLSLRRELGVSSFGINQILLQPGQRGRIHSHTEQEEVYIVLQGVLTLLVDGEERELVQGDIARVGPNTKRQIANAQPHDDLLMIALGGHGEHIGRDGEAFETWDQAEGRPPQETPMPADLEV
jgi:quercetin dioxygenase-like cupin family protein